ncbi:hypothetical protein [Runella sp.]|uniref:hypothetical protein n=1 Tax=Runella sp. TaxID=1960881 RepID=UPI003D0C9213
MNIKTLANSFFSKFNVPNDENYRFPGRWIGGTSMIFGPLLLLSGILLRLRFHFFFPQQLAAYQQNPTLITASYSLFLAGNILLWPAIVLLARLIGQTHPGWATWGSTMVIFGLFARTFHAGIDQLAFQLVNAQNLDLATKVVADSYGAFHIVAALSPLILFGWVVLAIGTYLSGTLGIIRAIALGSMSALMMGVLKGSTWVSVVSSLGLCAALIPLGFQILIEKPTPGISSFVIRFFLMIGFAALLLFIGRLG